MTAQRRAGPAMRLLADFDRDADGFAEVVDDHPVRLAIRAGKHANPRGDADTGGRVTLTVGRSSSSFARRQVPPFTV